MKEFENYAIICRSMEEREVCLTQMKKRGYDFDYDFYLRLHSQHSEEEPMIYHFNNFGTLNGWMDEVGWYVENGYTDKEVECSEMFHNQLIQKRLEARYEERSN